MKKVAFHIIHMYIEGIKEGTLQGFVCNRKKGEVLF